MSDILNQIMTELDALEESAERLKSAAAGAGKQTDLEVAILNQQMAELQDKNRQAVEFIDQAAGILNKLRGKPTPPCIAGHPSNGGEF